MWIAYVLTSLLLLVFVSGVTTPSTSNYFNDSTVSPDLNLTRSILTMVEVNVTDSLNGTVSSVSPNSLLNGSDLVTIDYNFTTDSNCIMDSSHSLDSDSPVKYNCTSNLDYTTDTGFTYALDFTEDTSEWTEGMTSTEFPDMIILIDEDNHSEVPTLNKTLTSKDLENKLNKAEKIGAIVGSVMAIIILAIIIAIYFLYRKYRSESLDY